MSSQSGFLVFLYLKFEMEWDELLVITVEGVVAVRRKQGGLSMASGGVELLEGLQAY